MNFKNLMLSGVALALLAGPAFAQTSTTTTTTKTVNHHRHHVAAANSIDARIDELEAQIHELRAAQAEQARKTKEVAAAAQAAPQPAADQQVSAAQFEALQNQVYEQQAADTAIVQNSWWSNTKIGGRAFFDISGIDAKGHIQTLTGNTFSTKSPQDGVNYDLKRFYFIVDHKFNDMFAANLTTDLTYDSSTGASQVFIKKAYLEAKFDPGFNLRVGASELPWIPFVESINAHRYIENMLTDRTKFGTSTDWGAHLFGTFFDGVLGYQISAINGFGFKAAPIGGGVNRSQGIDLEGRVNVQYDGFVAAVGGYDGKLGKDVQNAQVSCSTTIVEYSQTCHTATRFDALVGYTTDQLRLGVEYFSAQDYKTVATAVGAKADGYSAFASYQFEPEWGVFGRYDWVKPTDQRLYVGASEARNQYYNFGVSYSPIKQLDFALVYKHDSMQNGFFSDSEFTQFNCLNTTTKPYTTIGSCNAGTFSEIGLFTQLTF